MTQPIYLDYQATTPIDPRVRAAMQPWLEAEFANPHSIQHAPGRRAADAVEAARIEIAAVIGAQPRELVFTSGATEANNLAIKGAARFLRAMGDPRDRVVTLATEHKCVLESVRDLAREGFRIEVLSVEPSGLVDLDRLAAALDERTALVSIMAAHNEYGVIQDLPAIGALARRHGVLFHVDAAQAFGKIDLDVAAMGIGLLSISGHKIYAPKGVGALYVRHRPRVRLEPLFSGGGQERGLRSGTLAPFLCVALGRAAAIARTDRDEETARIAALAGRLTTALIRQTDGITLNGDPVRRLPGNINLAIEGVPALELIRAVPDLALSTGSACSSAELAPSYALMALGLSAAAASSSVRIGIGRFTQAGEIDRAGALIADAVAGIRDRERRAGPRAAIL